MLLIPAIGGLRLHSPLSPYKKLWNPNLEKCVAFWDPIPILLVLAQASIQYGICTLHTQIIF